MLIEDRMYDLLVGDVLLLLLSMLFIYSMHMLVCMVMTLLTDILFATRILTCI